MAPSGPDPGSAILLRYHVGMSYSAVTQVVTFYVNGATISYSQQDATSATPQNLGTQGWPYIGR